MDKDFFYSFASISPFPTWSNHIKTDDEPTDNEENKKDIVEKNEPILPERSTLIAQKSIYKPIKTRHDEIWELLGANHRLMFHKYTDEGSVLTLYRRGPKKLRWMVDIDVHEKSHNGVMKIVATKLADKWDRIFTGDTLLSEDNIHYQEMHTIIKKLINLILVKSSKEETYIESEKDYYDNFQIETTKQSNAHFILALATLTKNLKDIDTEKDTGNYFNEQLIKNLKTVIANIEKTLKKYLIEYYETGELGQKSTN